MGCGHEFDSPSQFMLTFDPSSSGPAIGCRSLRTGSSWAVQLFAPSTLQKTQVVSYDRSRVTMAPRGQIWGHPGPESTELVHK